jgi:dinuclear metal center YbgI/SA1388 family protein
MKIQEIVSLLENIAPPHLQESYDNAGLLTGNTDWECTGIIVALDTLETVVQEAIDKNCNLVVAHHPIVFSGLKKITGKNYVERTIIAAIKNDIAVYAIHTNIDNLLNGVNGRMADRLGLVNRQILQPKNNQLKKLSVFVPATHAENIRMAIFNAGGGEIGNYSECSFNSNGEGTFKAGDNTSPFVGKKGERHTESEVKVEVVINAWMENKVLQAMLHAHPYEEVAYDVIAMDNRHPSVGSGITGYLKAPLAETDFLHLIKNNFNLQVIRHTKLTGKMVNKVALCGGAGSFLTSAAVASGADFFISSDIKYHEFFDAEEKLVIADIGHYESEQYTIDLLFDILKEKYITFAVLKTGVITNPVSYFI